VPRFTFENCRITVEAESYAEAYRLARRVILGNDAIDLHLGHGALNENPIRPWRPIVTAPRDRPFIRRSADINEVYSAEWSEAGNGWMNLIANRLEPHITHWIPMPED
jgi:hypothetical protein